MTNDRGEWMPKGVLDEWQAKASALDRLEKFAGTINYGGRLLQWDGTPGSLLQAIQESDASLQKRFLQNGSQI